jgi:hypothetical protein
MFGVPVPPGFDMRVAALPPTIDLAVDDNHRDRPGRRGTAYEQLHRRRAPSLETISLSTRF